MRLLDLFCGAGGAAMGYHQAGFTEIVGVDIEPQPNYPFRFIRADAMEFLDAMWGGTEDLAYDLIHASPPCQAYSNSTTDPDAHPDLVGVTIDMLDLLGLPYVVENVVGAPLRRDLLLCGSMFGMEIQRHRVFQLGEWWMLSSLRCEHSGRSIQVTGNADGPNANAKRHRKYRDLDHARELMGMPWVETNREVTEAIPPAYTKWIGSKFVALVSMEAVSDD